jgi:hypothetical protein
MGVCTHEHLPDRCSLCSALATALVAVTAEIHGVALLGCQAWYVGSDRPERVHLSYGCGAATPKFTCTFEDVQLGTRFGARIA